MNWPFDHEYCTGRRTRLKHCYDGILAATAVGVKKGILEDYLVNYHGSGIRHSRAHRFLNQADFSERTLHRVLCPPSIHHLGSPSQLACMQ